MHGRRPGAAIGLQLGRGLVMPPTTALLLEHVPAHQTGTAGGVFHTSRQVGGALAVAVFGALISAPAGFGHGLRISLAPAAAIALLAALAALDATWMAPARHGA
ncbi:hypothetical protein GCM10009654_10560 [Streptomyces hebeiensis]|uniref:Major facilitator superfamily (MFS) profile domain-containing protein n=1 Tax=Streptomyces hebeiensis TaxID=229486 RepID=A0ABP4F7Z6_9ACTN